MKCGVNNVIFLDKCYLFMLFHFFCVSLNLLLPGIAEPSLSYSLIIFFSWSKMSILTETTNEPLISYILRPR